MFRRNRAIAALLITLIGLSVPATAQTPATATPDTAYRQKGKWVGYVPSYQKYSQPKSDGVFRSSLPDVTSFLTRSTDRQVKAATAEEPLKESAELFEGALLDNEETGAQPRVLAVGFDEPTPALDPAVDAAPMYDPGADMYDSGAELIGDACSTGCGPCAASPAACCPPPRFYGTADYLLWWTDSMNAPPLVSTGILNQAGTSILFGGSGLEADAVSGGRFTLGMWLDPCQMQGVEASYFMLGTRTASFGASDADYAILGRPFYNTVQEQEDVRWIVSPGLVTGAVAVTASTKFDGGELLFRQAVQRECWAEIDLLVGYRWLQLEEGLLIEENTESVPAGTTYDLFDEFDTRNSFHGSEVGMAIRRQIGYCWSLELLAKAALGNVSSTVAIDGQTTITTTAPPGFTVNDEGLLTQYTNIGRYERDKLAAATELGVKLRRAFGNGIDLTIGYTFLYLSDVLRPGDQIDVAVDERQLSPESLREGVRYPQFSFRSDGFWAQGLSLGIEGRF
ncbi:MAG: BBP7 family outer membrane beta-barrel protein [Planctomycetaceae bacterium]|nr:BBP7 family outer membrane beta-barrel protein [Planctomycetaceae bacterium]